MAYNDNYDLVQSYQFGGLMSRHQVAAYNQSVQQLIRDELVQIAADDNVNVSYYAARLPHPNFSVTAMDDQDANGRIWPSLQFVDMARRSSASPTRIWLDNGTYVSGSTTLWCPGSMYLIVFARTPTEIIPVFSDIVVAGTIVYVSEDDVLINARRHAHYSGDTQCMLLEKLEHAHVLRVSDMSADVDDYMESAEESDEESDYYCDECRETLSGHGENDKENVDPQQMVGNRSEPRSVADVAGGSGIPMRSKEQREVHTAMLKELKSRIAIPEPRIDILSGSVRFPRAYRMEYGGRKHYKYHDGVPANARRVSAEQAYAEDEVKLDELTRSGTIFKAFPDEYMSLRGNYTPVPIYVGTNGTRADSIGDNSCDNSDADMDGWVRDVVGTEVADVEYPLRERSCGEYGSSDSDTFVCNDYE